MTYSQLDIGQESERNQIGINNIGSRQESSSISISIRSDAVVGKRRLLTYT